jgi:hypothetical protein
VTGQAAQVGLPSSRGRLGLAAVPRVYGLSQVSVGCSLSQQGCPWQVWMSLLTSGHEH